LFSMSDIAIFILSKKNYFIYQGYNVKITHAHLKRELGTATAI